ncbi:hypothetical protein BT69DRAFT_866137 [Atractiella rhizophila]|nr:hypothetical protein BT69DRAFT_866137 [Atractiella rhizophila]
MSATVCTLPFALGVTVLTFAVAGKNPILEAKVDVRKRGIELQSFGAWCPYFQKQILRMGQRVFNITKDVAKAEDNLEKLNNLRLCVIAP